MDPFSVLNGFRTMLIDSQNDRRRSTMDTYYVTITVLTFSSNKDGMTFMQIFTVRQSCISEKWCCNERRVPFQSITYGPSSIN